MLKKIAKSTLSHTFGSRKAPSATANHPKSPAPTAPAVRPLLPNQCRVMIEAPPLSEAASAQTLYLHCTLRNDGPLPLASTSPNPVHLAYKWFDEESSRQLTGEAERTALLGPLLPGASAQNPVNVRTPPQAGRYILRLTLVQEGVAWFDDVDRANAFDFKILVG